MKRNIYLIVLLALLGACSHPVSEKEPGADAPVPVKVMTLSLQEVREPVYASGSFSTDDETVRSFKTGGIVQRILVR